MPDQHPAWLGASALPVWWQSVLWLSPHPPLEPWLPPTPWSAAHTLTLDLGLSGCLEALLDTRSQAPTCFLCLMTVCSHLLKKGLNSTCLVAFCGDDSCLAVDYCSSLQHRLQHHAASQRTPSPSTASQHAFLNSWSLAMVDHQESLNVTVPDLFVVFQLALLCPILLHSVLEG